jgi:pimeloyl-ACP methyl ester carboxylesterase
VRPTLVLVHGLMTAGWIWGDVRRRLGDLYRIRVVELPGHGGRAAPDGDVSLVSLACELAAVATRERPAVLVGLSLGAIACAHAAARLGGELAGLVLVAMPYHPETPDSRRRRQDTLEAIGRLGARPVLRGMAPWLFGRTTRRERPERVEEWLADAARLDPTAVVRTAQAALHRPAAAAALAAIRTPTLVVGGGEDELLLADEPRLTAARIAGAAHCEIAGAGHMVPIERGDALAHAIERWLEGGLDARDGTHRSL